MTQDYKMKDPKNHRHFGKINNYRRNNNNVNREFREAPDDSYSSALEPEYEVKKWYEEFPEEPTDFPESSEAEISTLKAEAEKVLHDEAIFYSKKNMKNGKSHQAWVQTVLSKGTSSDKIAANVVIIQDSPVYNISALGTLINMVKVSKKKDCIMAMETLTELFLTDLLRPGQKLKWFEDHPLSLLFALTSGNAISRRKRLATWAFEDQLKRLYLQFVSSVDIVSKDTVEANREKAVSAMYKLLAGNPEREDLLLKNLVNKVGDTSQKVASKVIYCLTQLLRVHPNMKQVVMNEVEKLLFRSNVGPKAQYYGICFLSQYHFDDEDAEIARNIISIYFSFFKASIKKGEVESRLMSALLMGVNRAYPFAKLEMNKLNEHIDTMYKLVHLASFSISLQALCLLHQIVGQSHDRFYCALYKKILDPHLANTTHQAMFVNLVYKALSTDDNIDRVKVFIKRLLQVCCYLPVHLTCGLLYTISQLITKRRNLFAVVTHMQKTFVDDDDDEEEHFVDVPIKDEDKVETKQEEDTEKEEKPIVGGSWHHKECNKLRRNSKYDAAARNPAYAGGDKSSYTELTSLSLHFHPTVSLFASKILNNEKIIYSGDPLADFTFIRFLERFCFKNPKTLPHGASEKGPDPALAMRKFYTPSGIKSLPVISKNYLGQIEEKVPVDEVFLFRYLKQRREGTEERDEDKEDTSDIESVASEEFEEILHGMMGNKDLDFSENIADNFTVAKKNKMNKNQQNDESDEDELEEDEMSDAGEESDGGGKDSELTDLEEEADGELGSDLGNKYDDDDSDAEAIDFDGDGDDKLDFDGEELDIDKLQQLAEEDERQRKLLKKKGNKQNVTVPATGKKVKSTGLSQLFAPAEEFAEMLEETGASGYKIGTADALSNKDNASIKQLRWETSRNHWVQGGKKRKFERKGSDKHKNKRRKM